MEDDRHSSEPRLHINSDNNPDSAAGGQKPYYVVLDGKTLESGESDQNQPEVPDNRKTTG
ncbi:hypothetical protein N7494_012962 [Penicillium frequentans]|uniref:Uncharacterized protein n=1 Tax=Penicillium frequentans TaxID=3151616 RepID=A0AAD6GBQ5_9EURO|nr:hypothetical protein N7494_012962 [Penicillium glabrum]